MHTCHFWAPNENILVDCILKVWQNSIEIPLNICLFISLFSVRCLLYDWTLHQCHVHVTAGVSEGLVGSESEVRVGRLGRVLALDLMGRGWGSACIFTQRGVWLSLSACSHTDSHRLTQAHTQSSQLGSAALTTADDASVRLHMRLLQDWAELWLCSWWASLLSIFIPLLFGHWEVINSLTHTVGRQINGVDSEGISLGYIYTNGSAHKFWMGQTVFGTLIFTHLFCEIIFARTSTLKSLRFFGRIFTGNKVSLNVYIFRGLFKGCVCHFSDETNSTEKTDTV